MVRPLHRAVSQLATAVAFSVLALHPASETVAEAHVNQGELSPCVAAEFDSLRASHHVFVAWFYAPWCPTCLRQQRVLRELVDAGIAAAPRVCRFDFDDNETLRERLGVASQSTLVRFRDGTETSRSQGETKPERLRPFLEGP